MKFTLSWLKDHLDTEATVDEIAEALTDLGLEVESVERPCRAPARLHHRPRAPRRAASRRRPPARLPRRDRSGRAADRLRRAERARRASRVVVAHPGTYVPGIDTTIQVGAGPRRREPRDDGFGARDGALGRARRHHRAAVGRGRASGFVDWLAANDPGRVDPVIDIAITPNRPDALGVHGVARDLAARGLGTLIERRGRAGAGRVPEPDRRLDRRRYPRGLPALRRAGDPWRDQRPEPGLAAGAAAGDRPAPDLGAGGHHQLLHLRHEPAAARLRRGQGDGRPARPSGGGRRAARRSRRAHLHARAGDDRDLGRERPREPRRRHGRRGDGRHRRDHRRLPRERLLGPGDHRADRARPQDPLRRALPFRARRRPGLHPARARGGDGDDPRDLRRRAFRGGAGGSGAGRRPRLPARPGPDAVAGRARHSRRDAARDARGAGLPDRRRHGAPAVLAARRPGRGRPGRGGGARSRR